MCISTMFEDSQRFSEEEGDESSHVVRFNPRSTATYSRDYRSSVVEGSELKNPIVHTMQRDAGESVQSLVMGADDNVDTPKYDDLHTNIREESLQRILHRLSPNGQRMFLNALSEGGTDVRPPSPFSVPETDMEEEHSGSEEQRDKRSEVDYLLDSPIPELTTKSLIPPPENEGIQSGLLKEAHPNVMSRVLRPSIKVRTGFTEVRGRLPPESPPHSRVGQDSMEQSIRGARQSHPYDRPRPHPYSFP